jgi:hypothetical protein
VSLPSGTVAGRVLILVNESGDLSPMSLSRRTFLRGVIGAAGGASATQAGAQHAHEPSPPQASTPGRPPVASMPGLPPGVVPVETPDVPRMPWRMEDGVNPTSRLARG